MIVGAHTNFFPWLLVTWTARVLALSPMETACFSKLGSGPSEATFSSCSGGNAAQEQTHEIHIHSNIRRWRTHRRFHTWSVYNDSPIGRCESKPNQLGRVHSPSDTRSNSPRWRLWRPWATLRRRQGYSRGSRWSEGAHAARYTKPQLRVSVPIARPGWKLAM